MGREDPVADLCLFTYVYCVLTHVLCVEEGRKGCRREGIPYDLVVCFYRLT